MWHRKAAVAGSFYPGNERDLKKDINKYLDSSVKSDVENEIFALIVPHAGYVYSAPVAASAYKLLKEISPDSIIILAPSHRASFKGASVFAEGIYETPLGPINLMTDFSKALLEKPYFGFMQEAHQSEHSLEVQIPFIQVLMPDVSICPIVMGSTDLNICTSIGRSIGDLISAQKGKTLIIISTDLSHFHPYDEAVKIDGALIDLLEKFDEVELSRALDVGKAEACGHAPLVAGMHASKIVGATKAEIIEYRNSGDTAGTRDSVVGYLSAAFTK